jgi:ribosomal-protein-alanine N-acetyltransferase
MTNTIFNNPPVFQTLRLNLRELVADDLKNMHQLHSMPEVDEYNTLGIPKSMDTTRRILNDCIACQQAIPRTSYVLSMHINQTDAFVGYIALNLSSPKYKAGEVWYKVHPRYWRQGYATEALHRVLEFAFRYLLLHRVEAGCATENVASIKVLRKVGMTREGHTRKKLPIRGQWMDNYEYAILEEDYFRLPGR